MNILLSALMPKGNKPKLFWRDLFHVLYILFILPVGVYYNYDRVATLPDNIGSVFVCALGCLLFLLQIPGNLLGSGYFVVFKHFQPIYKRAQVC